PLPWRAIGTLLLLNALGPMSYELIFPFINQMLVELEVVNDPERVGFYSGIVESVFALASLVTIMPMSFASDRWGRKPVILLGMTGLGLSLVLFGISRTFAALLLSRSLGGALGGVWAAVKIMVGELTDRSNQSIAFNALTLTYRIGQIVGLPLGGFLAHPERHFPDSIFSSPFWLKYPFLFPCLVGAAIACGAVILGAADVQLPHTLPAIRTVDEGYVADECDDDDATEAEEPPSVGDLLRNRQVLALVVSNFCMCLTSELLFNVYPLFAYTDVKHGGLGFNEAQIGLHLSARAMIHLIAIALFNPMYRWIGRDSAVRIYQFAMTLWPFVVCFYPFMNYVARKCVDGGESGLLFYVTAGLWFLLWRCIGMLATDVSPSASALAGINGIIQMSLTLPQVITPAFSNSLFAYSIEHEELFGGHLVWVVFFVIACFSTMHAFTLDEPTEDWRE
ncbi:MFS general substrate transporter, partial [Clavulina sp. PMI_390]